MTNNTDHEAGKSFTPPREISSEELLRGAKEIWIRHGEEMYRLRLTRSGKLILQK
jgi:hemin uptake protein HemP